MQVTTDDYGDIVFFSTSGIVSTAHDIVVESAGSRKQLGGNHRGPYHYKCKRCELVWLGKTETSCYPHQESKGSGYSGGNVMPLHKVDKRIHSAYGYLYMPQRYNIYRDWIL